jgi:autotransporter-associated beta strand protein
MSTKRLIFLILLLMFGVASNAFAIAYQWNGVTDTDFDTGTNWTPNGIPVSGDDITIVFAANQPLTDGAEAVNSITFDTSGGAVTLTLATGAFTLDAGSTISVTGTNTAQILGDQDVIDLGNLVLNNDSTGLFTIGGTVDVQGTGAGNTITFNGSNDITIGATANIIESAGTGTIVVVNMDDLTDVVTLAGPNAHIGVTTITQGTVNVQNDTGLGTIAGGVTVAAAANAKLQIEGGTDVGAEALTLAGGASFESVSGVNTYDGAITLSADATLTSTAGSIAFIGGVGGNTFDLTVAGDGDTSFGTVAIATTTGTLTKTGAGTLTLGFDNTYTGLTTISAGKIIATTDEALGTTPVGTVVASGATLELDGAGIAYGAEPLTLNGADGLVNTTNAVNDWTGPITLGANAEIVTSGVAFIVSAPITNAGYTLTLQGDGAMALTGGMEGTGGLTLDMTGAIVITVNTVAHLYSGDTTITSGVLTNGAADMISDASDITLADAANAKIDLNGGNDTIKSLAGGGATGGDIDLSTFTLTVAQATNTTYAGNTDVTAGLLIKSGAGILTLTGANGHTGLTTVSAGTLRYGVDDALSSGNVTVAGGTYDLVTFDDTVGTVTLTSGTISSTTGILTGTTYAMEAGTVSAILAGGIPLAKTTVGVVTLSGANTFTGDVTIAAAGGELVLANAAAFGVGAKDITMTGGILTVGATINAADWVPTVTLAGAASIKSSVAGLGSEIDTAITIAGNLLTIIGDESITISGSFADAAGGVTVNMTAITDVVTLSGTNLYDGVTTVSSGNLTISGGAALDDAHGDVIMANVASALFTAGATETMGALSGGGTTGGNVAIIGTLTVTQDADQTYAGIISGNALTKAGANELTLTGASTYTGLLTVTAGTLNLQNATATGTIAAGTVLDGGTIELQGGTVVGNEALTLNVDAAAELVNVSGDNSWEGAITLTDNATINTTAGTLTLGVGGISGAFNLTFGTTTDLTVNGVIGTGVGTVTKTGVGALTLNGANTYTGATSITAGTANFNGVSTGASTVTASNSATIAGTGTIPGALAMTQTSILAPGASDGDAVGTLTVTGAITFTNTESKYMVTVTGGFADKLVGGADVALAGASPNIQIQSDFDASQLTVPVAIIDITAAGTYAQNFDDALLIADGFTIDQDLVAGLGLVRILTKPTTTAGTGTTVMTVLPSQLPKGAYVNGPDGFNDDNYFWQTIEITFGAVGAAENLTIDLPDYVYVADTDDDANVSEEVALTTDSGVAFTVDGTSPTTIAIVQPGVVVAGDKLWIMFPVITDLNPGTANQDDYSITFSTTSGQNISHGDTGAPEVTFRDAGALQLFAFSANMAADDDSTSGLGQYYPDTALDTHGALPDFIDDTTNSAVSSIVLNTVGGDDDDTNDITYTYWVSTDSTLSHISEFQEGVSHAENYDTVGDYVANEAGTGNERHYTGGLAEGDYFVYVTSDFTGDFPLARSGMITVTHPPVVSLVGWDLTGNGFDNTAFYTDDADMTLDTGGLFQFDGTIPATSNSTIEADIYVSVDDLDDNAQVTLFYSSDAGITSSDVQTSGSPLVVDGLTGAEVLTSSLLENQKDNDGLIKWTWTVDPEDADAFVPAVGTYVPSGDYSIYAVANDGKNVNFLRAKGNEVPTDNETINIRHSPNLNLDVLTEYNLGTDAGSDADVTISTALSDVIMISWGKNGVTGDSDPDDSSVIEFYIDYDTLQNDQADYSAEDYAALRIAASGVESSTGTHKISVTAVQEDDETKALSYYAWNLKEDFIRTGWLPTNQAIYHLYAIIDENKTGGTVRVIALGSDGIVDAGEAITEVEFDNATTFARLTDPPAKGMTLTYDETVNLRFDAFDYDSDGQVGIFLVESTQLVGGVAGAAEATITELEATSAASAGKVFCLTDDDGDHLAGGSWLSENDDSQYPFTISTPGAGALRYNKDITGVAATSIDGTYWVYIGVDPDNSDFNTGTEILYKSPGTLTIVDSDIQAPQRNLALSPTKAIVAQGDTLTYSVKSVDPGGSAVLMDVYIAVEKAFFDLVPPSVTAPFSDPAGYGTVIENTITDDTDRWILHATIFNSGNPITPATSGLGTEIASFQLVSKGTEHPVEEATAVSYVNEPENNWVTGYTYSGETATTVVNTFPSDVRVQPRAIVEGIVEFDGRNTMALTVTFELRERDSYVASTDSIFIAEQDVDAVTAGLQYTLDVDGKFTLMKVPSGEWDLVVLYDRYLSSLQGIEVYPGDDDVYVDFGTLLGGDATGYTDASGGSYPDNEIDSEDLDQISDAYLDTSADVATWDDGIFNYKWCDINQNGKVEVTDLQLASANQVQTGAQPVYKIASEPGETNFSSTFELKNVPETLTKGETYDIQVVALNTTNVRGYYVNLGYNESALTFTEVDKGNFINDYSYSFSTSGENTIGFTNAVYGPSVYSGNGIVAEFTFTADRDGLFTEDMIGIVEATVVNRNFMSETVLANNLTELSVDDVPTMFDLTQNFPNPFNPTTSINFSIPEASNVKLEVFDVLGHHVDTLVDAAYTPGSYSVVWDAKDKNGNGVSAGVYFYTINSANHRATKRMMFLK